ncbi:MAG: DUF4783 domain-containing protein [Chitinophagales bacterium]|nr:DUF4783 domain-containing protein [Chitinophagales bacterium]MDW8392996.1 DUF4783 domain-containing protein [Chitinophagales bacterium]
MKKDAPLYQGSLKHLFWVTLILFGLGTSVAAQNSPVDAVAASIRMGNSRDLARYFDDQVQIGILSRQATYSKTQGEMVLRDFFTKNKVKSFDLVHRGSTANRGADFAIGNLVTATQTFRVYFLMKQQGGQYLLQEINFEKP